MDHLPQIGASLLWLWPKFQMRLLKNLSWPMKVLRGQDLSYPERLKVIASLKNALLWFAGALPTQHLPPFPGSELLIEKLRKFEIIKKLKMLHFFLGHLSLQQSCEHMRMFLKDSTMIKGTREIFRWKPESSRPCESIIHTRSWHREWY